MANEVEIRITAHDLTGPAFASVMGRVAALKAALDDAFRDRTLNFDVSPGALAKIEALKRAADGISFGNIDMSKMNTGLMALRSKLQSLGIADLADIDVQPGRLMTQLQLIKRLINQSGISDVLDFNLTPADLSAQFAKLGNVVYDIPVKFDMSKMPKLGQIGSEHVPITFDYGRVVGPHMPILNLPANVIVKEFIQHGETMPVLDIPGNIDIKNIPKVGETGSVLDIPVNLDFKNIPTMGDVEVIKKAEEATNGFGTAASVLGSNLGRTDEAFSPFLQNILKMSADMRDGERYAGGLGDAFAFLERGMGFLGSAIVNGLGRGFDFLGRGAVAAGNAIGGLIGRGGGGGGGGRGILGASAAAGGAGRVFWGWFSILNGSIGGIRLWHVALDGALESTIALTTAAAALTVGLAAMAPTAHDIYTHLQAVNTVNQNLGSNIPPLTGKFQDLGKAMSSQTIEAYGGALNFINQGAGGLARTAGEVVTGIDNVIAKLDLWRQSQASTGKILQTGVGFLHQFEGILGSVSDAIVHLAKADPGTAHFLLDVVGAGAKLLDVVTKLPTPLLLTALGLHSIYLWGNVAAGVLGKLVGVVPGLKGIGDILSHGFHLNMISNPYVALTAGVVALGAAFAYLAIQGNSASDAVTADINKTNAALDQMNASQAIGALITDITKYQVASQNAFSPHSLANIAATTGSMKLMGSEADVSLGHMANAIHDLGLQQWGSAAKGVFDAVTGLFDKQAAVTHIAENNAAAYSAEIGKLVGSQGRLYGESGKLMAQGYSLAQSFALMDMAGVKWSDSAELMNQKVKNLITGYQDMSVSGNILANSVNAVSFAALQQQSGIQNLTAGWTAFFNTVSGGASTFNTFAQDLSALGKNAQASGASLTGLNDQSITLRGSMVSAASAAQSQMNALMTMASAAGLGTQGTAMLTQAATDYIAILGPSAKGSTEMTSILWALAQQGGLTSKQFWDLVNGVTSVKDPMKSLDGITTTLTKDSAGLSQDVQNLSTALGTTLNNAMAQVIFTMSGGVGPMNALAKALDQTGLMSSQTAQAAGSVGTQFGRMTGNVHSAYGEFMTFATQALGLTKQQADILWQESLPSVQAAIDKLHGKTVPIKGDNGQALGAARTTQQVIDVLHGKTVKISVDATQALNAIATVQGGLANTNSKSIALYVTTYQNTVGNPYNSVYGSNGKLTYATGGIMGSIPHAASGGWRQGLTMVGELGPELVRLPTGSQVYPHGVTPGYASQGGGGIAELRLAIDPAGSTAFEQFMVMAIREWVRLKGGGNVQKAFGRNK